MAEVEDYFREIRSLLHGEPNEHNFKELCKLLEDGLRDVRDRAASELVPYAEGMMRLWPHRLRRMPTTWLQHIGARIPWHVSTLQPLMRTILISNRAISAKEITQLLDSELFTPIMRLEFQTIERGWHYGPGTAGEHKLQALLENGRFENLEELELNRFMDSHRCYDLLATSPSMQGIRALSLRNNPSYNLQALASSEHLGNLQELDLSHIPCGSAAKERTLREYLFEQTSKLGDIERLFLRGAHVSNEDLEALAKAPFIKKLTHLDLRDNKHVTAKGLKAVLGACDKGQLRSLDLSNTRLGGGGLKVLAKSHALINLELLRIHNVGWTEAGAKAMANSTTLPREFTASFRAEGDEDEGDDED